MTVSANQWTELSQAYAFLGNSLLKPMNQTEAVGATPEFWAAFPDFGNPGIDGALNEMCIRVQLLQKRAAEAGLAVQDQAGVEYTHLFIGPPSPAVAPWETFARAKAAGAEYPVGFGQSTFAMQEELRSLGLEVSNQNNQYADHIGIELLALSVHCQRAAQGAEGEPQAALRFIQEHPGAWISGLLQQAEAEAPQGYVPGLLAVAQTLMEYTVEQAG